LLSDAVWATKDQVQKRLTAQLSGVAQKARKQFFFEKKNQKTFVIMGVPWNAAKLIKIKVFCFFFSKKKSFLLALPFRR
jgi:hypothetical protein